jgi:hypothetical protein
VPAAYCTSLSTIVHCSLLVLKHYSRWWE